LSLLLLLSSCNSTNVIEQPDSIEIPQIESDVIEKEDSPEAVPDESQEGSDPNETEEPAEKSAEEPTKIPVEVPTEQQTEKPKEIEIEVPEIKENKLKIEGQVGNKVTFTLDELKGMIDIIFEGEYYSLNSYGTTKHNTFKGVNLWSLLETKAQILPEATTI